MIQNLFSYSNHFSFSFQNTPIQNARLGKISCSRNTIQTPFFYFCATKGALKSVEISNLLQLDDLFALLANTYHLFLRPGLDIMQTLGGLHQFMNWNRPLFTDSGGYQIFSMGYGSVSSEIKGKRSRKNSLLLSLSEKSVKFRSYIDGNVFELSPESSINMQIALGADFIVQLDECTPYHFSKSETHLAMERSIRWGDRSLEQFFKYNNPSSPQAVYGILQGGVFPDLREKSFNAFLKRPYFGLAIGGSLGSSRSDMIQTLSSIFSLVEKSE